MHRTDPDPLHESTSRRSLAAARAVTLVVGDNQHSAAGLSCRAAAAHYGVSERTVHDARLVLRSGGEIAALVEGGELSVSAAARALRRGAAIGAARVYFVQATTGGPIRIGWSSDVPHRVRTVEHGAPVPLRILGTAPGGRAVERRLHAELAPERVYRDWFRDSPRVHATLARESRRTA